MSIIENAARRLQQDKRVLTIGGGASTERADNRKPASRPIAINSHFTSTESTNVSRHRCATIDLDRLQQMGMAIPGNGSNRIAEEFRVIKRPLLRSAAASHNASPDGSLPRNLVMVTSSLPNEGRTFCAINLALSIAMEKDYTVLLVDADVAHPSVLDTLGISAETGLMDLLRDPTLSVSDVILHTNVPSLSIIPAGDGNRHATELLASQGMARLAAELARRYSDRIVIFDSPPLLATTNAQALAMHMSQIVVVVEAERTQQHQLKEALRIVGDCPNVSLLYNKARAFPNASTYRSY